MKTYKKNFIAVFTVILVMILLLPSAVFAVEFPKHQNYIADEAGILTEDVISELRDINKNLLGDYKLTIAVCTVNSIGDSDIAEYARQLYSNWKLGEGVLVLIAKEDNNYYFVPSTDMEEILTNEVLASIRDSHFEEDFANHTYERGVKKIAIKLKNTIVAGMQERAAQAEAEANQKAEESAGQNAEEKGTTVGSVIVGFFKVILWLVILAVILFVAVFVWAMFNEDVAAILQKLFFRRNAANRLKNQQNYYDDRLYGNRTNPNPQQRPSNAQRRPMPNGYLGDGRNPGGYPQNGGYPMQGQYPQQPNNRGAYPQQNGGYPAQGQYQQYPQQPMNNRGAYPQQNGGYPAQGQYQQSPQQPMNPQYPQQNYGQQTGYPGGQQGYPQQNPGNRYGNPAYGQVPQQNRAPMQNGDATVQFNIPRR